MSRIVLSICLLTLVVFLLTTNGVFAQDTAAAASKADSSAGRLFDHFVVQGGAITWFVLIPLSIATIALIAEHFFSIRRATMLPPVVVQQVRRNLEAKRYVEVIELTTQDKSMLSKAVNSALGEAANGYPAMQGAVVESLELGAGKLMRKIEYLNVIGNVSPMIGLLGTVYGMIGLFASIFEAGGIPEPARVAHHMSIALVTTFWGLMVAIPALSVFAFFRNRIDELTTNCAATADNLLSVFNPVNSNLPLNAQQPVNPGTAGTVPNPEQIRRDDRTER